MDPLDSTHVGNWIIYDNVGGFSTQPLVEHGQALAEDKGDGELAVQWLPPLAEDLVLKARLLDADGKLVDQGPVPPQRALGRAVQAEEGPCGLEPCSSCDSPRNCYVTNVDCEYYPDCTYDGWCTGMFFSCR